MSVMQNIELLSQKPGRSPITAESSSYRKKDDVHMHDFIQVFCVKSGSCIHNFDGDSQKLLPGEISIVPTFKPHFIDTSESELELLGMDMNCSVFKFSASVRPWNFFDSCVSPLCETVLKNGHVFRLSEDATEEAFGLFSDMKKLSMNCSEGSQLILCGKTVELLSLVAVETEELVGNRAVGNCAPMHEAFSYIHKNYNKDITLDKIAKSAMISERTLFRMFEDSMNISVHHYIQQLRLNHSKELLAETDRAIRDIANDSGFAYLSNFHRFFRANTGMSPCEFRERTREKM